MVADAVLQKRNYIIYENKHDAIDAILFPPCPPGCDLNFKPIIQYFSDRSVGKKKKK